MVVWTPTTPKTPPVPCVTGHSASRWMCCHQTVFADASCRVRAAVTVAVATLVARSSFCHSAKSRQPSASTSRSSDGRRSIGDQAGGSGRGRRARVPSHPGSRVFRHCANQARQASYSVVQRVSAASRAAGDVASGAGITAASERDGSGGAAACAKPGTIPASTKTTTHSTRSTARIPHPCAHPAPARRRPPGPARGLPRTRDRQCPQHGHAFQVPIQWGDVKEYSGEPLWLK